MSILGHVSGRHLLLFADRLDYVEQPVLSLPTTISNNQSHHFLQYHHSMDLEDVPKGKKRLKNGRLVSSSYDGRRDGARQWPKTPAALIKLISQQLASLTCPTLNTTCNTAAASSQQAQGPATFFLPCNTHYTIPGVMNTAGGYTVSEGSLDFG